MVKADRIKKAVAAVVSQRPAYEEVLHFYEKLFLAQEASKERLQLEPVEIERSLLSVKRKEAFPLIGRAEFAIEPNESEALLREICGLATEANEVLADASPKISHALDEGRLDVRELFSSILQDDGTYFDEISEALQVDKAILAFLAYSSVRPSIALCAEQLASYLDKNSPWEKGYCPICGSPPGLSVLREEGVRSLACSYCGHEWESKRLYCPFCDNSDQKTLDYFFSEAEKEYRVDVCHQCKRYIKTIDTRKVEHPFYPLVEQVSTLHLDLLAREQGLESGSPLWLRL
jgi:FdhE protein